jgi:tight adherence protein C
MTPLLVVLIAIGFISLLTAGVASVELIRRRRVVSRVSGGGTSSAVGASVLRPDEAHGRGADFLERLQESRKDDQALNTKLTQAGYDSPTAAAIYFLLRLSSMVVFPVLTLLIIPRTDFRLFVLGLLVSVILGYILPVALLDRTIRLRQERIRRAVPDSLDLMVVCVEAGVSLDAAILRVAKEISLVHRDLAHELHVVNRLTNAGVPRENALRGLWQRTGVEDIRALVSSLIQSEKWGTSVATVLRVAAETLRRKRRQAAEKKAKQAPLKMTFPLLFFILPALFIVIMGPAVVTIVKEFGKV